MDNLLCEMKTDEFPYRGGNIPVWVTFLESVPYNSVPWASFIHFAVWVVNQGKKPSPLGWVNFRLVDYRDQLRQGYHSFKLWTNEPNIKGESIV